MPHGTVIVAGESFLILPVASQQEDGVVGGHAQLQNRGDGLGNVGDLAEHHVGSHIVDNRHSNIDQKQKRHRKGICQ